MDALLDGEIIVAFLTLAALEIVLGIDNIIFLSIMAAKLPAAQQARARTLGLAGAMLTRIALLVSVAWLARLTSTLFTVLGNQISGRDLILIGGGAFLIYKAGKELIDQARGDDHADAGNAGKPVGFLSVIVQIMVLDIVFSLDSVITAVGMTTTLPQNLAIPVMIAAIVAAIVVMMFFAGPVSRFVEDNPGIKTLALAFLVLIGAVLIVDGLDYHVPKAYVYFAMGFSLAVELLNMWIRRRTGARE